MTKKLSIAGLVVAAAASSSIALSATSAKAACVTAGSSATQDCIEFNSTTPTTVTTFGYNDNGFIGSTSLDSLTFYSGVIAPTPAWTFSPTPITISNIQYSLNGGTSFTSAGLNATSVSLASDSFSVNLITSSISVSPIALDEFQIKFDIPGGVTTSNAGWLKVQIGATDPVDGPQVQTRSIQATAYSPSSGVPGPLPLMGAAAAFGFSRRLRSRVRIAA
jgi:hypothetical protein